MKCSNCGTDYVPNARFCAQCGQKISAPTLSCPWCHHSNSESTKFCTACGQSMSSTVLSAQDVRELRDLFRKGGCSDAMSREDRRNLNLLEGEEIITVIAKGHGGVVGQINRGSNSFADFAVNDYVRLNGPFGTVLTNNRIIFVEPGIELRFEDLTRYKSERQLVKGRPKYTLEQGNTEYTFCASLTTGTGVAGTFASGFIRMFMAMAEDNHKADQNWDRAIAYLDAFDEFLATIGKIWERQEHSQ